MTLTQSGNRLHFIKNGGMFSSLGPFTVEQKTRTPTRKPYPGPACPRMAEEQWGCSSDAWQLRTNPMTGIARWGYFLMWNIISTAGISNTIWRTSETLWTPFPRCISSRDPHYRRFFHDLWIWMAKKKIWPLTEIPWCLQVLPWSLLSPEPDTIPTPDCSRIFPPGCTLWKLWNNNAFLYTGLPSSGLKI